MRQANAVSQSPSLKQPRRQQRSVRHGAALFKVLSLPQARHQSKADPRHVGRVTG